MPAEYTKDPDDKLDYKFDFSGWLADGDTVLSCTFDVPSPLVMEQFGNTTTSCTVWISGGTAGYAYRVTCHMLTAQGRKVDASFRVAIKES